MADNIDITAGSGVKVATDDDGTAHHQYVKLEFGADNTQTKVSSSNPLPVTIDNAATGTIGVNLGKVDGTIQVNVGKIDDNVSVKFATVSGTAGVNIGKVDGTIQTNIGKIDDIVTVRFTTISGTAGVNLGKVDGTIQTNVGKIDDYVAIKAGSASGSLAVHLLSTNGTIAVNLGKVDGTVAVYLHSTGGTLGVRVGQIDGTTSVYLAQTAGTVTVKLDPASAALVNAYHTANIFTVSGSTSGVSASGVTLISPSANASFKVFGYSFQTTGITSAVISLTNGAGTSPTEFWRPLVTAVETTSTPKGANALLTPPGFIFATGVSTTLALLNTAGVLVHYSVSYFKESA